MNACYDEYRIWIKPLKRYPPCRGIHIDYNVMQMNRVNLLRYGPLARYENSRLAHAPGMPGTFSPTPRVSDPDMHHGTCLTHEPWCMRGSLTSGFLWSRWRGKRFRHSRCMRNPQFYVSGKRPMTFKNTNRSVCNQRLEKHKMKMWIWNLAI